MKNIGIIDLGSNSTRLLVVKVLSNKSFKILDEIKEVVRLGKDIQEDGSLNPKRVKAALLTLEYFKRVCESYEVTEIVAVATAAVRAAKDQQAFLRMVKDTVGLEIRVLSGEEEAFYDYFGIVNSLDFTEGLIIDIGGASTEIIYVKNRENKESVSLPFGAITLTDMFDLSDEIKEENLVKLRNYLVNQYNSLPWLSKIKGTVLIGVGGTVRNMGKICRKDKNYSLDLTHNYVIDKETVKEMAKMVSGTNLKQRKKLKGLSKSRVDIFVGACEAVKVLFEYCKAGELIVSGNGVKEGLVYEYLQGGKIAVDNVLAFSLHNLMLQYDVNEMRIDKVWQQAKYAYKTSRLTYNMDERALGLLKIAVKLYTIGIQISYYDFYKHSFYMILHARINGLSHREVLMVAYTILYHPKEDLNNLVYGYRDILSEEDIDTTQKLGSILKMAIDFPSISVDGIMND